MYCKNCGKEIVEGGSFCSGCGTKVEITKEEEDGKQEQDSSNYNVSTSSRDDFKEEKKKMVKAIVVIGIIVAIIVFCFASASAPKCKFCHKKIIGAAYEYYDEEVMCKECAEEFYYPLDIDNFRR